MMHIFFCISILGFLLGNKAVQFLHQSAFAFICIPTKCMRFPLSPRILINTFSYSYQHLSLVIYCHWSFIDNSHSGRCEVLFIVVLICNFFDDWWYRVSFLMSIGHLFVERSVYSGLLPLYFKILFIYFSREGKGEREREKHQLPLTWPPLGTWPATQASSLTGNWTGDP